MIVMFFADFNCRQQIRPSRAKALVSTVDRHRNGCALRLHHEHQELRWRGGAGATPRGVDVARLLVEHFAGAQCHFLAAFHAHDNAAFQHTNKSGSFVAMRRRGRAGRRFDGQNRRLFPRQCLADPWS